MEVCETMKNVIRKIKKPKAGSKKLGILPMILIVVVAAAVVTIAGNVLNPSTKTVVTSAALEEAVEISQLSTAEFTYNGIAEYVDPDDPENENKMVHIAYESTVKVGIDMGEITFEVDDEEGTVTVILPEISVTSVTLDESELSYMPENPELEMNVILALCREDAENEANSSEELYEVAEENLQSVIEALVKPILDQSGEYVLVWE